MKRWVPMLWSVAPAVVSFLTRWHTGRCLVFLKIHKFFFFLEKYTHVAVITYEYVRPELCGTRRGLITWPLPPLGWEFLGVAINEACSARFWQKYNPTGVSWLRWDGTGPTLSRAVLGPGGRLCFPDSGVFTSSLTSVGFIPCSSSPHLSRDSHQRFHLPSLTA